MAKKVIIGVILSVLMLGTSITAFAVETGGATITLIEGSLYSPGPNETKYYSNIVNDATTCSWTTYDASRYAGRNTEIAATFNVSTSNNYGTLKFVASHYGPNGVTDHGYNIIRDASTGETICQGQTVGEYVYFTYTGRIPSKIKVLFYYNMPSDTAQAIGGMYVNWSYEPISENEQEETKAQVEGNKNLNEAMGSIPDNSQGFIDSLRGFASSMSYSGTDCAWTFPAITLPAIPGVMPSYQLTSEKPIDFSYWINQIPANLLLLIQSLLTIGLIIYCFKEVYGTISYVLTLRGGGSE